MTSSHVKRLEMIEMRPPSKRPSEEGSHLGKNVENITEVQESETEVFGHIKRRDQEYVGRQTGDGIAWDKKIKTEAEMDGLCQPRHKSYRDNKR